MVELTEAVKSFEFKPISMIKSEINPLNTLKSLPFPFNSIEIDESWAFEHLTRKETAYITHGYHRYPAKFIPQLARRLIEEYTKEGDIVCDTFMGCGTTLVEALVSGRKAVGVDINPVAWLITKAKTTPINPVELKKEVERIVIDVSANIEAKKGKQRFLSKFKIKAVIPENERIDYWFPNKEIKEDIGIILGRINEIQNTNIRNFCLCAFSNILKSSSIWLMKSIKPTRDLNKVPSDPYKAFSRQIKAMLRGNEKLYELMPKNVKGNLNKYLVAKKQDARNLPCDDDSVSLIVTSPPYVTSYEYADLHQLTALWLNHTKTVSEFREGFIGSVHKKEADHNGIKSELAKKEIEELSKKSKSEAEGVRNYFFEMQQCFEEMYRVLKHGGKTCIVIGDTELKNVPILNAEVFVEIMLNLGFKVHKVIKRRIPSKILPQTRDSRTGRFTTDYKADRLAYPHEYILIMEKV